MAPIKFEDNLKDKLEKRTIQPSADVWNTLVNRLDSHNKKKKTPLFWWFGIAASIVGILLVTVMYFNAKPLDNTTPIIVNTDKNIIQEKEQEGNSKINETSLKSDEVVVENIKNLKESSSETISNSNLKTVSKKNQVITDVQEQKAAGSSVVEKLNEVKNSKLTFENQKIQEVVAQINDLKANGKTISDTEIDSLLKKAQKEILSNRINNENTRTVDANALLQDVEEDLQQSFRSKVFEALQSGYESVKTAVAARSNKN